MNCTELTTGLVAAKCNNAATAGAEDEVILLNFNDVDKTESKEADNVISEIVMLAAKKGFKFETFGKSLNDSGVSLTKGSYRNTAVHTLMLRIFVKTENAKKFVNSFVSGAKVIAIVKNKEAGQAGDVKYEVYGWDNGLELNELTNTLEMADGVVYTLNVGSSDVAQEASLPKSVFDGDMKSTEMMLQSLVS